MNKSDKRSRIRVGIVDDHSLLRKSLLKIVNADERFEAVIEAVNGEDLLQLLEKYEVGALPEIILLDISMPIMDGLETALQLKHIYPSIKVIACTMHSEDDIVIKMLKIGVRGYLLKNIEPEEFIKAIATVSDGGTYFSGEVYDIALNQVSYKEIDSKPKLNEREKEIIKKIMLEKSSEEIGAEMFLSKRTIDGYVQLIIDKLKVKSRVGIVVAVLKDKIIDF